jgi:MOSC domain-containing protein YiiM
MPLTGQLPTPCRHPAELVGTPTVHSGLVHTGLRASILKGGTIRPGDHVEVFKASDWQFQPGVRRPPAA